MEWHPILPDPMSSGQIAHGRFFLNMVYSAQGIVLEPLRTPENTHRWAKLIPLLEVNPGTWRRRYVKSKALVLQPSFGGRRRKQKGSPIHDDGPPLMEARMWPHIFGILPETRASSGQQDKEQASQQLQKEGVASGLHWVVDLRATVAEMRPVLS